MGGNGGFSQTLIMLLVGVFTIIGVNMVEGPLTDASTVRASETVTLETVATDIDAATTQAVATDLIGQTVTLSSPHWYSDGRGLTVSHGVPAATETNSGVFASGGETLCVLGTLSEGNSIPLTGTIGLGSATVSIDATGVVGSVDCTITYLGERADAGFVVQFLLMFPFLMLVGGVIAMFGASFKESQAHDAGNPTSILMRAITVIIGAVMLPVLLTQVANVNTTYSETPFVAVATFTGLLPLAYILSLLNVAIPQIGSRVMGATRRGYRGTGLGV